MHKLILDTNVVVSSLIQKNYPFLILEHCLEKKATVCLSPSILREYLEVLNRPKFARFNDFKTNAEFLLIRLSELAVIFEPSVQVDLIKDNPDNRFLELAEASAADFIVTGNSTDFKLTTFASSRIVSPREYWEEYKD